MRMTRERERERERAHTKIESLVVFGGIYDYLSPPSLPAHVLLQTLYNEWHGSRASSLLFIVARHRDEEEDTKQTKTTAQHNAGEAEYFIH